MRVLGLISGVSERRAKLESRHFKGESFGREEEAPIVYRGEKVREMGKVLLTVDLKHEMIVKKYHEKIVKKSNTLQN